MGKAATDGATELTLRDHPRLTRKKLEEMDGAPGL